MRRRCFIVVFVLVTSADSGGCGDSGGAADDAGVDLALGDADDAAVPTPRDAAAAPGPAGCDMTGAWVMQHVTTNTALGAPQFATKFNYHRFEQEGTRLRIVDSLDCGYVVRGTTDVSLSDDTLEALATMATNAVGVEGSLETTSDGDGCAFELDRIYTIRGADKARFLDALWQVGDPPKPLSEFPLPASAAEGMEDWDGDGHEGITQLTGLGDRYSAQIDWYALQGTLPLTGGALGAEPIGGEGVISADYDSRESVSAETPALLQASSVPEPPGFGWMVRADALEVTEDGDRPELETCKKVQALAVEHFGDPPRP